MNTTHLTRRLFLSMLAMPLILGQAYAEAPAKVAEAKPIEEMVHYELISPAVKMDAASGEVVVQELFSYNCGHCFHFEPTVAAWLAKKPKNVRFERIEVAFNANWVPLSKGFYALKQLGKADALNAAIFDAVHVQHRPLGTPEQVIDFVASRGVDREAFTKAYNSFAVDGEVRRGVQLARQYGVTGVPSVVVQGMYRTEGGLAGGNNKMFEVVDALVARLSAESGAKSAGK